MFCGFFLSKSIFLFKFWYFSFVLSHFFFPPHFIFAFVFWAYKWFWCFCPILSFCPFSSVFYDLYVILCALSLFPSLHFPFPVLVLHLCPCNIHSSSLTFCTLTSASCIMAPPPALPLLHRWPHFIDLTTDSVTKVLDLGKIIFKEKQAQIKPNLNITKKINIGILTFDSMETQWHQVQQLYQKTKKKAL